MIDYLVNKKIYLILLVIFSFSLSACDSNYFTGTGEGGITGTQGIKMEFIPGTVPQRIVEGESYKFLLRIENKGAVDIENGYLDFSSSTLNIENQNDFREFQLRGGDNAFRGEDKIFELQVKADDLRMQDVDQISTNIKINACYEYSTRFEGTMCIDSNPGYDSANKPCSIHPVSGGSGQGAPVVVSRVLPMDTMGTVFDVYIRNARSGTVLSPGVSERVCREEFTTEDFGIIDIVEIRISRYKLSEGQINCESHTDRLNQFDLTHRRDYITCRITEDIPQNQGTFTTPLTIELEYGYLETLEQRLSVTSRLR